MTNTYKITHYYADYDNEFEFILKTELDSTSLLESLTAGMYRFAEHGNETKLVFNVSYVELLEEIYPVKDVTRNYEYPYHKSWQVLTCLKLEEPFLKHLFIICT